MDAPVETQLPELTSDARHARNELPELSHSQSIPDCPFPNRSLSKRKSLRIRPTDLLEEQLAIPPLPLRSHASQPELRSRPSKMSLFNLFSKPKVEKLRGYAEAGLETQPRAPSHSVASSPRKGSVQDLQTERGNSRPATSSKPQSVRGSRLSRKEPPSSIPPVPQTSLEHRTFEPLPWFQVLPQAIRHGTFEASTISPDVVLQRNRQRAAGSTLNPGGESSQEDSLGVRGSVDSRSTVKTAFRSGSIATKSEDISKKAFVLVTSGYLLQYPETGGNHRMPEKILKLGKDSAAFASDLVAGRHHVLQVSHAVDAHGGLMNDRQSIFAKLSLRNHTSRRMVSNFIIIMPGAQELGQWLTAIRIEIQRQGGPVARSDSPSAQRPRTGELPKLDLRKTPSQSHRYLVKRDPSKVLSVISPLGDTFSWFPSPLESPAEEPSGQAATAGEEPPVKMEADSVHSRPRATSDSPSLTSSTGQSVEQQQLEMLRDSTRISHTSTAATTSTFPSRSNSLTSSPPADPIRDTIDGDHKSSYRSLSSYSLTKRRSAVPIALSLVPALSSPEELLQQRRKAPAVQRAVSPKMSPVSEIAPPRQRLSAAQSVPNFREKFNRNDSTVASPSSPGHDRPESFLGDLPDPTTWASKTSPGHQRTSFAQQSPVREKPTTAQARPNGRTASQSFSLPLRVNPSDTGRCRSSRTGENEDILSPIPAVHTLSAKVNLAERYNIDTKHIPARSSSADPRRASARLSLFPTAEPATSQRSQPATANALLRRPTSLQVRNPDQAAFLASSRSYSNPRTISQQRSVTTIPIRRLKPSRSLQTISSEAAARNFSRQSSLLAADEDDHMTPLPTERRPSLPAQLHLIPRTRTSIVPGDFKIPLGPPAPPPRAPLPELPPLSARSRSRSPMPQGIGLAIGEEKTAPSPLIVGET